MEISIILAVDNQYGIGKDGTIPWYIPDDLERFRNKTNGHVMVMGYKTYQSLKRPLPNRIHLVLSSQIHQDIEEKRVFFFRDWESLLKRSLEYSLLHKIFFIGGSSIIEKGLTLHCTKIYLTRVYQSYSCDTNVSFLEPYLSNYELKKDSKRNEYIYIPYQYQTYTHKIHPEYSYLRLLNELYHHGEERMTRNGITLSQFGRRLTYDISTSFPLLTTKRVYWKAIVEELIWFLNGRTNAKELDAKGVKIWNGNSSQDVLQKLGLPYEEGDCGSIYGFIWRHWGAEYKDCHTDYTNQGYDQIENVIHLLRHDKHSRRILFSGWDPLAIQKGVLPPCHVLYQFYVDEHDGLHCQMYQRSCDIFLGCPFNIASTALLTYLLGHYTNLKPKTITVVFGDVHIYDAHRKVVLEQLIRTPYDFCQLEFKDMPERLENVGLSNCVLNNYNSHSSLQAPMIV